MGGVYLTGAGVGEYGCPVIRDCSFDGGGFVSVLAGWGIQIWGSASRCTVENCWISDYYYGGISCAASYAKINNITFNNVAQTTNRYALWVVPTAVRNQISNIYCYYNGANTAGGVILGSACHYTQLSNLYCYGIGSRSLFVDGADYLTVDGVYSTSNTSNYQFYLNGSIRSTFSNMYGNGSSSEAFFIYLCTESTFTGMGAKSAGTVGFYINTCNGSQFSGMTANSCGSHGFSINSESISLVGVTSGANTGDGINWAAGADNSLLSGVNATYNTGTGVLLGAGSTATNRVTGINSHNNTTADETIGSNWTQDSSGGITTIAAATDTNITTPASGNILIWDGSDSWDNKAVSGDITITSAGVVDVAKISGVTVDATAPVTD